jgi:hypothetical protein
MHPKEFVKDILIPDTISCESMWRLVSSKLFVLEKMIIMSPFLPKV